MADNVIQNIGIKATADTGDTVKKLNELSNGLKKVYESAKGIDTKGMSFGQLRQGLQQAQASLRSAEKDIVKYGNTMGQMWRSAKVEEADAKGRIDAFSSALKSLEKQASGMKISIWNEGTPTSSEKYPFGKEEEYTPTQYKFAPIDPSLVGGQELDQNNAKAEETISKFSRLRAKIGEAFSQEKLQNFSDKMSRISAKAGEISGKMGRVARTVGGAGKRFLSAINPMTMFRNEQNKLSLSSTLLGKAFSRLGRMFRIMVTRMLIRGFISNIREGFQNIAKYSDVVNQKFSAIISSAKTLYNAFASAFTPLIEAIAPYVVKALDFITSAMNKVAEFLSALTGKSYFIKATKYQTNYAKSLDKTGKSAGKTAKKVKELKSATIGIDKLNVIEKKQPDTSNSGSGSGAGGGGASANDMFDTKPVSKKMKDLAKEVKKIAKKLFDPIQKAWNSKGAKVLGSMKKMLGSIWETIKDIGRDFLTMWQQPATVKIFEDILDTVATIFDIVTAISDQFRKAWNKDNVGLHIFENLRDVFGIVVKRVKKIAEYTRDWAKHLNFTALLQSIERYTKSLKKLVKGLSDIAGDFYETVVLGISKWVVEKGLPNLIQVFTDFNNKVNWQSLRKSLKVVWEGIEKFGEAVGQGLIDFIHWLADGIADLLNSGWFRGFLEGIGNALKSIKPKQVTIALKTFIKVLLTVKAVKFVAGTLGKIAIGIGKVKGALGGFTSAFGSGGLSSVLAGAGLGVALVYLADMVSDIQRAKNQTRYLNDEEDNYLTKLEEEQSLHQSNLEATEKQNNNVLDLSNKATGYKKNLDKIVDKNGKIKEGYEGQAKYLTGELNKALGTNMKVIDGQVKGYKRGTKQLKKQLDLVAQKQILEQGASQYYDNQGVLEKGTKGLNKTKGIIEKLSGTNLKESLQTFMGAGGGATNIFNTLTNAINYYKNDKDLQKALKDYKAQLKTIRESYRYNIRYEALQNAKGKKAREKALKNMSKSLTKQEKKTFNTISNVAVKYNKSIPELITKNKNFEKAIKEAGLKGKNISAKLREGVLSNKIDVKDAVEYQKLLETAKSSGAKIPKKISSGIKGDKQSVKNAIDKLKEIIDKLPPEKRTKLGLDGKKKYENDADEAGKKVRSKIPKEISTRIVLKIDTASITKAGKEARALSKIASKGGVLKKRVKGADGHTYAYYEDKNGKTRRKRLFASGGFPKLGSEFIAGEKGAEFVGNINGKTGVTSNQEITGIREEVATQGENQIALLQRQNQLLVQLLEKETDVNIDGTKLTKKINKINNNLGYKMALT